MPSILFHAINGIGLGHVSRLRAIAVAIRNLRPTLPLLFAIEGESHGLLESAALPYVTLPPASRFEGGDDAWARSIRGRLIGSMAAAIVEATNPQLIIFDCLPNPAFVAVAGRKKIPFAICIRKAKGMDEYFRRLRPVLEQAQIIIFPHDSTEIEVPAEFIDKSRFVGTIARQLTKAPVDPRRDHSRIVISGGGGGYPGTVTFYNLVLEAVVRCKQKVPSISATLVTGPLFGEWSQLKPASGVQILPFDPEISVSFNEADLVICQGGYNTVAELIALGVPVICVPASRRFDDQHERARNTAAAHEQFFTWENSDSDALATFILEVLQKPRVERVKTDDFRGANVAAEILLNCLRDG